MIWEDPPFRLDEIPTFSRVFLKESGPKCHQVPTKIRTFWYFGPHLEKKRDSKPLRSGIILIPQLSFPV